MVLLNLDISGVQRLDAWAAKAACEPVGEVLVWSFEHVGEVPALVPLEAAVVLLDVPGAWAEDCLVVFDTGLAVCTGVGATASVRLGIRVGEVACGGATDVVAETTLHRRSL